MTEVPNELKDTILERFERDLKHPVRLVLFTQELECHFCAETHELIDMVASLSEKISLDVFDFVKDKEKAGELKIDKIPALAVLGKEDYGIRFFGIPSGYEFQTLVEAITLVSSGESSLPPEAEKALAKAITKPAEIQVLVIPTCPVCPLVATMGMQFAMASRKVSIKIVEIAEFPHLAVRYNVVGTPKTVINETVQFEGLVPPAQFINHIQQASQGSPTGISPTI
ncbi:MAG: thioredoxin family protein [Candidatus Hodarchaeota archaeon]